MVTLEQAEFALTKLWPYLTEFKGLVGLAKIDDDYVVKVNWIEGPSGKTHVPRHIDGIRIVYEMITSYLTDPTIPFSREANVVPLQCAYCKTQVEDPGSFFVDHDECFPC